MAMGDKSKLPHENTAKMQCQTLKTDHTGIGNVAQWTECLPSICDNWVLLLHKTEYCMYACNLSTWEVEVRESEVQGHPQLLL